MLLDPRAISATTEIPVNVRGSGDPDTVLESNGIFEERGESGTSFQHGASNVKRRYMLIYIIYYLKWRNRDYSKTHLRTCVGINVHLLESSLNRDVYQRGQCVKLHNFKLQRGAFGRRIYTIEDLY